MKSFEYVIKDEIGLHARPAGLLMKEAKKYTSDIKVVFGDKSGSAKQVMQMMKLGIRNADTVTVTIEGADEDVAAPAIEKFFQENL